jgi:hypothetical protein
MPLVFAEKMSMPNNNLTRSGLLYDISRKLQEYLPSQNWGDIRIKSVIDLKAKYPGLASLKDARSLQVMQSLLSELESDGAAAIMRWSQPITAAPKKRRSGNSSPNTSGLYPRKSPDCTTKPVQISIMVEQCQLDFLDGLEGTRSLNIRQAIRHYQQASSKPSD